MAFTEPTFRQLTTTWRAERVVYIGKYIRKLWVDILHTPKYNYNCDQPIFRKLTLARQILVKKKPFVPKFMKVRQTVWSLILDHQSSGQTDGRTEELVAT
jgi:hypothetical protein